MDAKDLALHAEFLRRLARGLVADEQLAEDAAQEAIVASMGRRDVRDLRSWLAGAVRNISFRMRRAAASRRRAEQSAARREAMPSAEALAAEAETHRRVADAVLRLEEPYRSVVLLRFFHRHTPSEIARRSGEPVATVKTRLRRALAMLRARLDEAHGGDRVAWSAALLPHFFRRPLAVGLLGGVALMKIKVIAAAAALALLSALFAVHRSTDDRAAARIEPAAASRAYPLAPDESGAADAPARTEMVSRDRDAASEPVPEDEAERYREWRRVLPVLAAARRSNRETAALLAKLAGPEEETQPLADPTTASYLADLAREYRAQAAGAARTDLLSRFVQTHAKYLEATHDTSFLPFLEEVAGGSEVADERELAVPDCDDRTLDLLFRLARNRDPIARAAAVRALSGDPRGLGVVTSALEDEASIVRWNAALELEFTVADPAHVPALLARLPVETHPLAADSIVRAISTLDPAGGAGRIEAAVAGAPAGVRSTVLRALAPPEPEGTTPEPAPREAAEARPDEATSAYLRRLVAEYRSLPQGKDRLATVERLAEANAGYLRETGDPSYLPVLAEIARGSPVLDERVAVVRWLHSLPDRCVVDLVIDLKASPEPLVRSIVAGVLAWVDGPETDRARRELLEMLGDRTPSVRSAAALLVGVPLSDAGNVPRLLACLREETDVSAAYAMIDAILRLDPEKGRARIDAAAASSPSARPAIEAALRLRK